MKTAPRDQVNAMDGATYFKLFAELLKTNPPAAEDAPMVAKLAKIGIVPGQDFDASKLDPAVAKGIAAAPKPGQEKISAYLKEAIVTGDAKVENGWLFFHKAGVYGTSYRDRAMITWYGLGANRIQDAVYPTSEGPDLLKKYSGANKYVAHFNKGEMPPANAFWSITMYDKDYFFVPNPINRYTVSSRNKFKTNADGSVDLYIQHDSPGKDKEQNWLPAPSDAFVLMMRLYWPKRKGAVDSRRHVEAARGEGGFVTSYAFIYARTLWGNPGVRASAWPACVRRKRCRASAGADPQRARRGDTNQTIHRAKLRRDTSAPWAPGRLIAHRSAPTTYLFILKKTRVMALPRRNFREASTLTIFVPFTILYMGEALKLDYLWAALCIPGAVYFVFRG